MKLINTNLKIARTLANHLAREATRIGVTLPDAPANITYKDLVGSTRWEIDLVYPVSGKHQ